jgi:hypothetical protein
MAYIGLHFRTFTDRQRLSILKARAKLFVSFVRSKDVASTCYRQAVVIPSSQVKPRKFFSCVALHSDLRFVENHSVISACRIVTCFSGSEKTNEILSYIELLI